VNLPANLESSVRRVRALVVVLVVLVAAGLIGVNFGWQYIGAPVLGWIAYKFIIGNLRGLVHAGRMGAPAEDEIIPGGEVPRGERTLFWCEECGTEVLLLVRGTTRPTSHCGQRMHERTELLQEN
jgi:hypothetical protein